MPHLIDSDWSIGFLDGVPAVVSLIDRLAIDNFFVSIITYIEVYEGIVRSPDLAEAGHRLERFLEEAPILPVTVEIAERCARLRETLRRQGRRVNTRGFDLIIAATAIEHGLTLVTRNTDDYRDTPGLRLHR